LDKGGEGVDGVATVPRPTENNFFVRLEGFCHEYTERDLGQKKACMEVEGVVSSPSCIKSEVERGHMLKV
jgi:hypothetical protein